jgi:DNA-binding NtrC family response regulator
MIKPEYKEVLQCLGMVGNDWNYLEALQKAHKYAAHEINVLIVGEQGVGRYAFARFIHELRHPGCDYYSTDGGLSNEFIRAELLGQASVVCASENTGIKPDLNDAKYSLLVRNIHRMSGSVATNFLHLLDTGRWGPQETGKVCVIATALVGEDENVCWNPETGEAVSRLFPVVLTVPSLNQRRTDVVPLAKAFLAAWNAREGQEVRFDAHALRKLQDRPWPGNLVELRREVEMKAMVCEGATIRGGMIEPAEGEEPGVAPADGFVPGSMKLDDHLEGLKRGWVRDALARCAGKKSAAADLLGWTPQRMHKYLTTEAKKGHSF